MWAMVRSTTWRIRLMRLLASSAASLSSPLGGFLWGVIIPLPTFPLSAIHPEGSIPSSSPEASSAATSCMDPGQGSETHARRPLNNPQSVGATLRRSSGTVQYSSERPVEDMLRVASRRG